MGSKRRDLVKRERDAVRAKPWVWKLYLALGVYGALFGVFNLLTARGTLGIWIGCFMFVLGVAVSLVAAFAYRWVGTSDETQATEVDL